MVKIHQCGPALMSLKGLPKVMIPHENSKLSAGKRFPADKLRKPVVSSAEKRLFADKLFHHH